MKIIKGISVKYQIMHIFTFANLAKNLEFRVSGSIIVIMTKLFKNVADYTTKTPLQPLLKLFLSSFLVYLKWKKNEQLVFSTM